MSERYIEIRNWERYQNRDVWRKSGGRPPWIKAYTKLLSDDDYLELSMSQRGLLMGLWLMYASAGKGVSESGASRVLVRSESDARYWKRNIEALNHAGFIRFVSRQNRAPLAPRVEESREEVLSQNGDGASGATAEKEHSPKKSSRGAGWVENLGRYTGCKLIRGTHSFGHVYDPLGVDQTPSDWAHPRPTREEILEALAEQAHA